MHFSMQEKYIYLIKEMLSIYNKLLKYQNCKIN